MQDLSSERTYDTDGFFKDFQIEKIQPKLYSIYVFGDSNHVEGISEWCKLGKLVARRLSAHNKRAFLVSTSELGYLVSSPISGPELSASFKYENKDYKITAIEPASQDQLVPEIIATEEFVYGLNAWLFFFDRATAVEDVLQDEFFVSEIKTMISSSGALDQLDLKFELIAAVKSGCAILWFNP